MNRQQTTPPTASGRQGSDEETPSIPPRRRWELPLSIVVAFNFAIAQPVLDLLGRNPQFFVAHDITGTQLAGFALLLTFALPLVAGAPVLLAVVLHPVAGRALHMALWGSLLAALALQFAARLLTLPQTFMFIVAGVIAVLATVAYHASSRVRTFVSMGLIAPPAFAFLFLFASPASALLRTGDDEMVAGAEVSNPAPVVMIVFDEFPAASVMDAEHNVDAHLFPNFARLARDGTWYRNATAVNAQTKHSLPSILTGRRPDDELVAIAAHHPESLFTLLGEHYEVRSFEPITQLCADNLCQRRPGDGDHEGRSAAVVADAAVVYLHHLLPATMTHRLPPIDDRWAGFAQGVPEADTAALDQEDIQAAALEAIRDDRRRAFRQLVEAIEPDGVPRLYFLHSLLPHSPWRHLPSGQVYEREERPVPGRGRATWAKDDWLVLQAQQRHLVQVGLTDRLLGEIFETLDQAGVYDSTLIIVTADHGIAFEPGVPPREPLPGPDSKTLFDVASVPLFIKQPFQQQGGVEDEPVELIDILPTVADVLGVDLPWSVDGRSLVDPNREPLTSRTFETPRERYTFDATQGSPADVAERKNARFPDDDEFKLYRLGAYGHLVGLPLGNLPVEEAPHLLIEVEDPEQYGHVDLDGTFLPAHLWGEVVRGTGIQEGLDVAVALNGRIAAVTRTYTDREESTRFTALLPPDLLQQGENHLEVFAIHQRNNGTVLLRPDVVDAER